jgi:hypothetical protein
MNLDNLPQDKPLPLNRAFRHLIVFQIKLFVDAFRDLIFSPISLFAFAADALMRPPVKDSLSYKLMVSGRQSDRMINLFDEYTKSGDFTIDTTVAEVESAIQREIKKHK